MWNIPMMDILWKIITIGMFYDVLWIMMFLRSICPGKLMAIPMMPPNCAHAARHRHVDSYPDGHNGFAWGLWRGASWGSPMTRSTNVHVQTPNWEAEQPKVSKHTSTERLGSWKLHQLMFLTSWFTHQATFAADTSSDSLAGHRIELLMLWNSHGRLSALL